MLEGALHKETAESMHQKAESMILQKQKSTVAIALSIANNHSLVEDILKGKISNNNYDELIRSFKENTLYKNIWIQILDKDATSLYRSWSDKKGDNLLNIRTDLQDVISSKKVMYSISVGKFNLSLKAIVPVIKNNEFIGIIEIISHFNSISRYMKKFLTDSVVVVAKKEYKKQLIKPFTNLFIGDYYVANFDAPKELMKYLYDMGVENYFHDTYRVENGYVIASHELLDNRKEAVGYFIMFKKIENISSVDLDFFMFKWFMIGVLILMSMAGLVSIFLFYVYRRDKKYYQSIIDTSNNIIMVHNENGTVDVNRTFFRYFNNYITLGEFKLKHRSICEFFIEEDGCLRPEHKGVSWIEHMINYSDVHHKIKMKIDDKVYYFSASASKIDSDSQNRAIIMSDITKQENYKNELERLSITDTLTNIRNRRFFQQNIEDEINRVKRYGESLSLVIFDVDHFKGVNDKYGHNVGDEVLIEYTKLISKKLRSNDIFCRIGGEEFIIILPHTHSEDARLLAEKLRVSVEKSKKVVPITMSFGVVEYIKGEDSEAIFKRADQALYKAKDSGRNMVVVG